MSYTEFTYQLLQAYDFLHMFKNEGINVQIGGSDQWGNITAGTHLLQKNLQTEEATDRLTWKRFGRDKDLGRSNEQTRYVHNTAQIKLAEEVTRSVHGEEGLKEGIKATKALRAGAETKLDWNLIESLLLTAY